MGFRYESRRYPDIFWQRDVGSRCCARHNYHKSDWDLPQRLNSSDCFRIAKATWKYERRGVIAVGTDGEGDRVDDSGGEL